MRSPLLSDLDSFKRPAPGFDIPQFLEVVWSRQQNEAAGEFVYYQTIRQDDAVLRESLTKEAMDRQMLMVESVTAGLVRVDPHAGTIMMRQAPQVVLKASEQVIRGQGFDHRLEDFTTVTSEQSDAR